MLHFPCCPALAGMGTAARFHPSRLLAGFTAYEVGFMMKHETHPIRGDDTREIGHAVQIAISWSGLGGSGRQTDLNLSMTG